MKIMILSWFLVIVQPGPDHVLTRVGPFLTMEQCAQEMFYQMQTDKENIFTCEQSNLILLPPNR